MFLLKCTSLGFNGFVDTNSTTPLFCLVNRASLDRILQSEVYVKEVDSQMRAAHLILGYMPISRVFQAPRCVIRAEDPRLHRISVAYEGFVVPEGIPLPNIRHPSNHFLLPLFQQEYHHLHPFFKKRRKDKKNMRSKALWT